MARVYAGSGFSQVFYREEARQHGDISDNELYHGDFKKAVGAITAKAHVVPSETDLYFPPADSAFEVAHMPNATLMTIPSIWGHFAGGSAANPADVAFLDGKLRTACHRQTGC